jgi:hypothetical protein
MHPWINLVDETGISEYTCFDMSEERNRAVATILAVEKNREGLLIPREALGEWYSKELEAVWEKQGIVIRPRQATSDSRAQVRQALREAGMLYQPAWQTPPPVSQEDRARLAQKLAQGESLSEVIIADREDRA